MSKWLLKLKGHKFDILDLSESLNIPEFKIIELDGIYYLDSNEFKLLTLAEEVRERGRALIKLLNTVCVFQNSDFHIISEDGVLFISDDGKRNHYVYAEDAIVFSGRSRVKVIVHDTVGNVIENNKPPLLLSYLTLAQVHKPVIDALSFFQEDTWFNLYKVYEIIIDDIGNKSKLTNAGWITKKELSRFTQTAQSRAALGEQARHASAKYKPPIEPMAHTEAKSLIRKLLSCWIDSKNDHN